MRRNFIIFWAYLVEWLAAGALLALLCSAFGVSVVAEYMRNSAAEVAAIFGVAMFTGSIGFLWAFYTKADTDFYTWLNSVGALSAYANATVYVVAISLLAAVSPLTLKLVSGDEYALVIVFAELLALINLYTLIKNVMALVRMNAIFNQLRR